MNTGTTPRVITPDQLALLSVVGLLKALSDGPDSLVSRLDEIAQEEVERYQFCMPELLVFALFPLDLAATRTLAEYQDVFRMAVREHAFISLNSILGDPADWKADLNLWDTLLTERFEEYIGALYYEPVGPNGHLWHLAKAAYRHITPLDSATSDIRVLIQLSLFFATQMKLQPEILAHYQLT